MVSKIFNFIDQQNSTIWFRINRLFRVNKMFPIGIYHNDLFRHLRDGHVVVYKIEFDNFHGS